MDSWYERQMESILDRAATKPDTLEEYIEGLKAMREMIDERITAAEEDLESGEEDEDEDED